ncbi:PP2C family protein-serine/threonine phosphatase [Streptomyces nitrosporeus]|uniref:PP2C family protein-serine/threonine phosphatase n=1 Tax=Streptomyces nitrosporeus TaxID=28894 RepID=UPI001E64D5D9|nr:PP2C family protein-serine/threonine phosphatase [Streptomyces nitrosporeus]
MTAVGTERSALEHRRAQERSWPPPWLRLLPPALIVLTVVLDQVTPPRYFFGSLLSASIVLAIFTYPPLGVGATGAAGCAALALIEAVEDYVGPQTVTVLIQLGTVTLLSVALCVVRYRAEDRLRRVRAVAEAVQLALLRPLPAQVGPVRIAGFYRAADDEALIGGDLYSVRPTPFGVRVIVGDVKGKGVGATRTVATVISTFREAALLQPTLPQLADRIDVALQLDRDNVKSPSGTGAAPPHTTGEPAETAAPADELFVTAVLLEFSPEAREVRVLNRGHQPLLVISSCETSVVRTEHSLPLGMGDLLTEQPPALTRVLGPDDILVAYSDGVTEARDPAGAFYPLREQLQAHCDAGPRQPSPSGLIDFIQHDLARWAPALADDVVAIALQPAPPDRR